MRSASTSQRHGVSVRLPPGRYSAAERSLDSAAAAGISRLRLQIQLDDWHLPGGRNWFRWLTLRAREQFQVVAALARPAMDTRDGPPPVWTQQPDVFGQFVTQALTQLGGNCEWLELSDPLGSSSWPDISRESASLLAGLGIPADCRLCLGGLPLNRTWLERALEQGLFNSFQALAFRSAGDVGNWAGNWRQGLAAARTARRQSGQEQLWLTPDQLGASSGTSAMGQELAACSQLLESSVDQIYLPACADTQRITGNPDLVSRIRRSGGNPALQTARPRRQIHTLAARPEADLVIGGAGFIGSNLAARLAAANRQVVVLDNLSRPGTELNAAWLSKCYPDTIRMVLADIRDFDAVYDAVSGARRVFHLAGQVAVTTSLDQPHLDQSINTLGTINVLEAVRRCSPPPLTVFTSTNKVYGSLADIPLRHTPRGYEPTDAGVRSSGIGEDRTLSFCSPYGCSKGAADQYVLDYAGTFGLPTAVLRMSCIYGPRQFGNEDQGWVAHFMRQMLDNQPITIYGDGFQVRDLLFVEDLINALLDVADHLPTHKGQAFNVGGGPFSSISLRGLLDRLAAMHGPMPPVRMRHWRPADQRYYVSDTSRLHALTGWQPTVNLQHGLKLLYTWMQQEPDVTPLFPSSNNRRIS